MQSSNELFRIRCSKRDKLIALGVNPHGCAFDVLGSVGECIELFEAGQIIKIAGRITRHRDMGKLHFMDLWDITGRMQISINEADLSELEQQVLDLIDLSDFIGVEGEYYITKTGEKTVKAKSLTLLSKSLRPMPKT